MAKATGMAKITAVSGGRQRHLSARLQEHGVDGVLEAIRNVGASDFCRENNNGWCNFDWLVERGMAKAREGKYANRRKEVQTEISVPKETPEEKQARWKRQTEAYNAAYPLPPVDRNVLLPGEGGL
jgi:hypothetical protein